MNSYADAAKMANPSTHMDEASENFIKEFSTKTAEIKETYPKLSIGLKDISKYCETILNMTALSTYEKNNGFYPITLEFPKMDLKGLEEMRKTLSNYDIPFDKIYIGKGTRKMIHLMIKNEQSLLNIIRDRSKLGTFITSSRDFHVLTGRVRIPREKAGIVDALIKTAFAEEIPYAIYNTIYSTDHLIVFGLIECKIGDQMKSGQHITEIANFTIRTATKTYSSQKKNKKVETNNTEEPLEDEMTDPPNTQNRIAIKSSQPKPQQQTNNPANNQSEKQSTQEKKAQAKNNNIHSSSENREKTLNIPPSHKRKNEEIHSNNEVTQLSPTINRSNPYIPSTPKTPVKKESKGIIESFIEINELNADATQAHQLFPGSIISATNRGNGIGILNHNNQNIKLSPIFIIEGRLIISDILIKDTTTRILAIYTPAQPDKRKTLASTLNKHFNNQYHNLTSNPNKNIDIIAGDFNCLDFNDNHTSNDDQGNLTTQSPDEMATVIEAIRISNNLMDMDQLNKRPTFSRTIHNTNNNLTRILERRLDRIYLNNSLINYSQLYLRNLIPPKINDIPLSDHNFLSTTFTLPNIQMNKRRWRLKKSSILSSIMLKKIDFLLNDYSRELSANHNSISFSQLNSLLNKIKQLYTEFQKQNDYNNKANIKNLISLLETEFKDQAFATLSAINESKKREEQLKQELNNYCEETSLKYISARIKKRHNDFTINAVKDAQGRTINKQELIEEEYVKYYSNLYDYKEDDPPSHYEMLENWTVTRDSTWDNLENEFTSQEILEVIKQLNPHKSPGPDGIPNLFYITHKEKLAPILASAFNDTLRNPHLISKNYKEGLIITIPKKGDPELIKNRRPITLANCIYKIHSKLINNRIIPILTKVINHNQKGFVPGRFILDNIISMNELINYCNDKRINGIITLYDFEKAFDSISHGSILRSLQHINIPTNIINLIMNLLTKSEARIEINGRTTIPFEIKRGVKQGDPLSPTLFVLVIEALARKILQDDRITGLPLNNSNHREKFQSFADDSASMVPDSQQLELVLQHFNSFCKATSSKLNMDKSSSILIGNPDNTNQRIPISTNPERYLGYFFTGKGITRKMPEILNTIRSSLVLWKTTDSTIKTKTNILKAFALSKLTYYSYVENFKEEELNQIN
ncbi:hypothetical protein ACTFIT_007117 [Dictyostelium discoideum]